MKNSKVSIKDKEKMIINKIKEKKQESKYIIKNNMRKRIKNASFVVNVDKIEDNGLIKLKTGEVASIIEVGAVDLSLSSGSEKQNFFSLLKQLYQISGLKLKCYKFDKKINLNANKDNLNKKIKEAEGTIKKSLLKESKELITEFENNGYTVSSVYYWVVICNDVTTLDKHLDQIEEIVNGISPKIDIEILTNRLEIYSFLSNLYLATNTIDQLMWCDLVDLTAPLNVHEKPNLLKFDNKEIQVVSIKNVPPFVEELFLEEIFNVPNVRTSLSVKDTITQDELIRWVNSQKIYKNCNVNATFKTYKDVGHNPNCAENEIINLLKEAKEF